MSKLPEELQSLVESKILSEDEASLIQSVRSGEIENPIKTKDKTIETKEIDKVIKEINDSIEIINNLIEKTDKAIEMLKDKHIFKNQEFLSDNDSKQLKFFTDELRNNFLEAIGKFETIKEVNTGLKKDIESFTNKVENLFANSVEINDKLLNDNFEKVNKLEKLDTEVKTKGPKT